MSMYATRSDMLEPCPTCAALARTVMLDQVSFDRKPDCYGIRQITDDESVEEWEDIRTSPDVAREEAYDMMATGRGEIYEVVPLWTTPQPAPATQQAPQQEAQEPCPTCAALARTVMLDQVSFDRKPDCYGIRQITDDEGVEEWEDIRTSPDVAREEANDMMATGRGEIYEVVPLWTTPQPSPTPQADSVQEDAALWHWLAEYLVGPRTDLDDEIVASETVNDLRKLVDAAIKQGEKQ